MAIIISESGYPKYPIVNHASYSKLRGIFVENFLRFVTNTCIRIRFCATISAVKLNVECCGVQASVDEKSIMFAIGNYVSLLQPNQ